MSRLEDFMRIAKVVVPPAPSKSENETVRATQSPLAVDTSATKIGELNSASAMTRTFLNNLFDRQSAPSSAASPTGNISPFEGLKQIDSLPKPSFKGIENLPDADRQSIYQARVQDYNRKRAEIADYAIYNSLTVSPPPKREDFKNLPGRLAETEYRDALNSYNGAVTELKNIARESKQANLEKNVEFQKLPAETQNLVRRGLVKVQAFPSDVDTLIHLAQSPGFNRLSGDEQKHLINFVGGTNVELSRGALTELTRTFSDPKTDRSDPETFRKFLKDQPGLPFVVSGSIQPGEFDSRRRPFTLTGPEEVKGYNFQSGSADAQKYEVAVGGRNISVYVGKNQDPTQTYHSIDEVAKGLAALPPASLERVVSVRVDPKQNPDDAYWAKEYKIPNFRSYMTAGADGNISIYPGRNSQEVLDGSLIHETGHTLSKQLFGENTNGGVGDFLKHLFGKTVWNDWKNAMKDDGISPSVYAQQSAASGAPDEDFSETLELYMKVKGTPQEAEIREILPQRFALLDKILK